MGFITISHHHVLLFSKHRRFANPRFVHIQHQKKTKKKKRLTVDGSETLHQLRLVGYPIIYFRVSKTSKRWWFPGFTGFFPLPFGTKKHYVWHMTRGFTFGFGNLWCVNLGVVFHWEILMLWILWRRLGLRLPARSVTRFFFGGRATGPYLEDHPS